LLLLAAVSLAVLALLLGGCRNSPAGSSREQPLIVGDQRGGVQSLLKAAGELDHVPYKIEWAIFPAASPLLEALRSGAIDMGGIGGPPFAFAYGSGAKIRVVFASRPISGHGSRASAVVVAANAPIRSIADLRGKRVATVKGSAGQDLALRLLELHGLKPQDITWAYLANGEAKAALSSGSVDAWSTWGSYVGIAVIEDHDRVIGTGRELPAQAGFYAATDQAITDKRAQITDFVQRLARARLWLRTHKDDYARVLAANTGIPVDVARYSVEDLLSAPVPIGDGSIQREQEDILRRYKSIGLIDSVSNLNGAFDPSFSRNLAR
jgi:sulfonate transport system substrate-binding protein